MPVSKLRHIGSSHFESDECGSLNDFLALAPEATRLCSMSGKIVSVDDAADREADPAARQAAAPTTSGDDAGACDSPESCRGASRG